MRKDEDTLGPWRGGVVRGETSTDVNCAVGAPITVAKASFDPGYNLESTLECGQATEADLKMGFTSYGEAVGEKRIPGYLGGRK